MLGLACISLIRTLIGMIPAALLAIPFFGVSVFEMGFPLFVFFFNLVLTGWAMSQFVTAILIRYGLGAESLTWVLPFFDRSFFLHLLSTVDLTTMDAGYCLFYSNHLCF